MANDHFHEGVTPEQADALLNNLKKTAKPRLAPPLPKWLPDMDLNHDKQIQSLLCYRYTIGQPRSWPQG
jgi:hypothetical protein